MDGQPELILLWGAWLSRALRLALIPVAVWIVHVIYPMVNFSLPIRGQVVDADTGEPIEGAVVLATWFITGLEGAQMRILAIDEAVTDREGRFHIAGWSRFNFRPGRLDDEQPEVWYAARGYLPLNEYNGRYSDDEKIVFPPKAPRSIARGLKPVGTGEWSRYASEMERMAFGALLSPACDWVATPNTTRLMAEVQNDLSSYHPSISFSRCRKQRGADPLSTTEASAN